MNKKEEIINMLEKDSIEIIFNSHMPYMCRTVDENTPFKTIKIGDGSITGYNLDEESKQIINKIKKSILEILKK